MITANEAGIEALMIRQANEEITKELPVLSLGMKELYELLLMCKVDQIVQLDICIRGFCRSRLHMLQQPYYSSITRRRTSLGTAHEEKKPSNSRVQDVKQET